MVNKISSKMKMLTEKGLFKVRRTKNFHYNLQQNLNPPCPLLFYYQRHPMPRPVPHRVLSVLSLSLHDFYAVGRPWFLRAPLEIPVKQSTKELLYKKIIVVIVLQLSWTLYSIQLTISNSVKQTYINKIVEIYRLTIKILYILKDGIALIIINNFYYEINPEIVKNISYWKKII